jgi:3-oxoacyl-[acyl-carrier protein] reductase
VIVNHRDSAAGADEIVRSITDAGGRAEIVQADVSRLPDAQRLIKETVDRYARLDILVNNAGRTRYAAR